MLAVMQITERCDLRCHYCYLPPASARDMPLALALRTIDRLVDIARSQKVKDPVSICFHGGEPTLVLARVARVMAYARRRGINDFIIATNGAGLDRKMVDYIVANRISIIMSVDGVAPAHDHQRVFPDGRGSWRLVDRALDLLSEHADSWAAGLRRNPFRFRVTLTPASSVFLARTVRYLAAKPLARHGYITLVPGNYPGARWPEYKELLKLFRGQVEEIKGLFRECDLAGQPRPRVCLNECLGAASTSLGYLTATQAEPFCGPGEQVMGVSIDGRIYACHLRAVNCQEKDNDLYCVGTVQKGLSQPLQDGLFTVLGRNPKCSCLYWNARESGLPETPVRASAALYEAWCS
ncbi:MAG: radical SAM protein [Candidatus Omnitrophica bacterium]|nr:radical SAM protein [Candidatus Omnitrophota bacterium]